MPRPLSEDGRGAALNWLFLDLNSYFATVEQQLDARLRGRPVIVRPAPSEHTCAIAASYQAKAFGIRTGTPVHEARKLCPDLVVVEARPDVYVKMHHRIVAEVERHAPVETVASVDEMACRLMGPQREVAEAMALARRIKAGLASRVGEVLTCSIGLAPSYLLAKLASDMQKPDGLVLLRLDELPAPLLHLPVDAICGVGPRMRQRLTQAGITTMQALWDIPPARARQIWRSIEGERIWYGLHGIDTERPASERHSIGHGHVLPATKRDPGQARWIARHLTGLCALRLRTMGHVCSGLTLHFDTETRRSIAMSETFAHSADTFTLLRALERLWRRGYRHMHGQRLSYVGIDLFGLLDGAAHKPDLFGWRPGDDADARGLRLSQTLDRLEHRYGKGIVTIGPPADVSPDVGRKIAFNRIPD
ncbi:MAG: Y-family DNA polymerase [Brevundimonas sp.]|uniref:Y-family DNA polymerase n=1 Tax=Brevundimonas sp. TaxID=1871086 RepID=UPI00391D3962